MSNGDFWSQETWMMFNGNPAVQPPQAGLLGKTMSPMQVAQQVFPTVVTGNDNPIPADSVQAGTGLPTTGFTRAFATLRKPFKLFPIQVQDPALTLATSQVTLAAQALALVEDMLFFQGEDAQLPAVGIQSVDLPDGDKEKLKYGLLGIAGPNRTIDVEPERQAPKFYGLETFDAVVKGVTYFTANLQGPPYALILAPEIFADVNLPSATNPSVTPASAIQAVLASGPLVMSAGMRHSTGLLASLGGRTTTLYIGTGPLVEYNSYDNSVYSFTARESIQYFNTDVRSLIYLAFK